MSQPVVIVGWLLGVRQSVLEGRLAQPIGSLSPPLDDRLYAHDQGHLSACAARGTLEMHEVEEVLVMEGIWLVLFWTGPIGVGFFLACIGAMVLMLSKADEINKRSKALTRQDHVV